MSIRKGWLVLLALVMLWTSVAMAAAEGLDISITTDKTSYAADETAVLTIDITNQTNGVVRNLNIQNYIPTGLKYVTPSEANKVIAELQPGASARHQIHVQMVQTSMPETGDTARPLLWCLLTLTGVGYLVWRYRRNHRA